MNQILISPNYSTSSSPYAAHSRKKTFFRYQLILSILFLYYFSTYFYSDVVASKNEEEKAFKLLNTYNISRLYSSNENSNKTPSNIYAEEVPLIIGIIEINKLNIVYPIFSHSTDNLLKIAPCRFYGPLPNEYGNLCIAGHNYENTSFFSKLSTLTIGDVVSIYDSSGKSLPYTVYDKYETSDSDTDCTKQKKLVKELTLVTCNNINGNRIIVKALHK